jgi:hypothetical protein
MKKIVTLTILAAFAATICPRQANSQGVCFQKKDREVFDKYVAYIKDKADLPTGELITESARFFIGVPYVAHTLEIEPEGLVVNLRELDCTTFLETVFALSMTVKSGEMTFENFCNKLRLLRYREGIINDYTDRLHYTSDWIYTNNQKGLVDIVIQKENGEPLNLNLFIMSSNTDRYKQLKGKPALIKKIKDKENEINSREYYYLPSNKIEPNNELLQSGDMVGFVTTMPGIDISHVGIIYRDGGKLTFIHASSLHKKVLINEEPLAAYINSTGRNTGIVLARARF